MWRANLYRIDGLGEDPQRHFMCWQQTCVVNRDPSRSRKFRHDRFFKIHQPKDVEITSARRIRMITRKGSNRRSFMKFLAASPLLAQITAKDLSANRSRLSASQRRILTQHM